MLDSGTTTDTDLHTCPLRRARPTIDSEYGIVAVQGVWTRCTGVLPTSPSQTGAGGMCRSATCLTRLPSWLPDLGISLVEACRGDSIVHVQLVQSADHAQRCAPFRSAANIRTSIDRSSPREEGGGRCLLWQLNPWTLLHSKTGCLFRG